MHSINFLSKGIAPILVFSLVVRLALAGILELGNDEVYYWTYAKFPDFSHFDHPPMLGWLIQLFTANLLFNHELFLRLGFIVCGTITTYFIYLIGKTIDSTKSGVISAIIYNTSIYGLIISGTFVMPDGPMVLLWALGFYLLLKILPASNLKKQQVNMLLFGLVTGLGILSKYHCSLLWLGAFLYIIFYRRKWLNEPSLYLSGLITLLVLTPIIYWNIKNNFISFTFHENRVSIFEKGVRADFFFGEIIGQILYQNPFNFLLIVLAITNYKRLSGISKDKVKIIFACSLPLIGLVLYFSLFKRTLPHWSGPSYLLLCPLAAIYLRNFPRKIKYLKASFLFIGATIILGLTQIKLGWANGWLITTEVNKEKMGQTDVTLDMYGWRQLSHKWKATLKELESKGHIISGTPIISHKWFPASHIDYYLANPNKMEVLGWGTLDQIHKYAWINQMRKPLQKGNNAIFMVNGRNYKDPQFLTAYFNKVDQLKEIPIERNNKIVQYLFIYSLEDYKGNYPSPFEASNHHTVKNYALENSLLGSICKNLDNCFVP